jgi:hypothetical protein
MRRPVGEGPGIEPGSGQEPGTVAAASPVGGEEVLVAPGAAGTGHDAPRGEARAPEAADRVSGKIHVGAGSVPGTDHGAGEAVRHLGSDLEAAGTDGGAEDGMEVLGVPERGEDGLHDASGQAPPAGMKDGNAFAGGGEDDGQAVRGAYGQKNIGRRRPEGVAPGDRVRLRTLHPCHARSVNLPHRHRVRRTDGDGAGEGPSRDAKLGETGGKRHEPQDEGRVLDAPAPLHDGRA